MRPLRIRRWSRSRTAFLAVVLAAAPAVSADLDTASVVARLQGWLDTTRDLDCRFEQRLVSGALGSAPVESGRLRLIRPGHMRWDYVRPDAKVALLDGDRTAVYLPADRQFVRGRLGHDQGLLGGLLGGSRQVNDLFRPTLVATPANGGAGGYRVRLAPIAAGEAVEAVILTLRPPTFAIESAEVLDSAGNVVEYRFSGLRRNRGIPAEAFLFEPPKGTEIIESE